jgi:hypothetical protein
MGGGGGGVVVLSQLWNYKPIKNPVQETISFLDAPFNWGSCNCHPDRELSRPFFKGFFFKCQKSNLKEIMTYFSTFFHLSWLPFYKFPYYITSAIVGRWHSLFLLQALIYELSYLCVSGNLSLNFENNFFIKYWNKSIRWFTIKTGCVGITFKLWKEGNMIK